MTLTTIKHKALFYSIALLSAPAMASAQVKAPRRAYDSESELVQHVSDGSAILLTAAHSIKIVTLIAVLSTLGFLAYFFWLKTAVPDDLEGYKRARRWIFYNVAVVTVLILATMILQLFESV